MPGPGWHLATWLFGVLMCLPYSTAQADFSATVDRTSVSINDTLTLTLRSTDDSIGDDIDLSTLRQDFSVLNRQQSSKISFVNGKRTSSYDLVLTIAPERTGILAIPSFRFKGQASAPIAIRVSKGQTPVPGSLSDIFLDNQVNKQEVYVQEQILYTLRIYHSVGMSDANLSPLEIKNAVVKQLGDQKQFETVLKGVRYAVIEINYSIFPQSSGRLEIPVQTLTARTSNRQNNFFRSYGKTKRIHSPTQIINILPKPGTYPANAPWLPTASLEVIDSWADKAPNLKVGESVTRSMTLRARGLGAAQLPDLETSIEMVKNYPDKAQFKDEISHKGITGEKTRSVAYVPQQQGSISVPENTIYWWNTETDQLASTTLPAMTLTVSAPAFNAATKALLPAPLPAASDTRRENSDTVNKNEPSWLWPGLTGLFALLWIVTLIIWRRSSGNDRNRQSRGQSNSVNNDSPSANRAFKDLQKACLANDPRASRAALILWFRLWCERQGDEHRPVRNLDDIRSLNTRPPVSEQLDKLEAALYSESRDECDWQGQALFKIINDIKTSGKAKDKSRQKRELQPLYPL